MQVNIDGREYNLYFGFDALNYLDLVYKVEDKSSGVSFGYGLPLFTSALMMGNLTALNYGIKAGTSTEFRKPSNKGIEEFIVKELEKDGAEGFFNELLDELGKQPLTKHQVTRMRRETEKQALKKA